MIEIHLYCLYYFKKFVKTIKHSYKKVLRLKKIRL